MDHLDWCLGKGAPLGDAKAQPPHLVPVANGPKAWIDGTVEETD